MRVAIALVPGICAAAWILGPRVLLVVGMATATAIASEWLCTRKLQPLKDGSAVVTGLLIGLCLPSTAPLWIVGLASLIGIGLGKHAYGGLGNNLFNPAMVGYVAVLISFPEQLTQYDALSGATALEVLAHRGASTLSEISNHPAMGIVGSMHHEWINVALLLGGLYLVIVRIISWHMPLAVLIGLSIPSFLFFDAGSASSWGSPLFHWFAGGTMLTAFFIATDPVTSPNRPAQQWVIGLFVGLVTMLIREFGSWPDGFAFAILLANALLPLVERTVVRIAPQTP